MTDPLAVRFEAERGRLRNVAYRLLGSLDEADDAVQEAWLRLTRSDIDAVANLNGWLTTVVARIALDMLRTRRSRGEARFENGSKAEAEAVRDPGRDPQEEALLAEAVGLALLVVLDRLSPPERVAFVLHDLFGIGFDLIAPILSRSTAATRQLASRARRRVRGEGGVSPDLRRQKLVVAAFAAAAREGRFDDLMALLHPDVALKVDAALLPSGTPSAFSGAATVARRALASVAGPFAFVTANGRAAILAEPPDQPRRVLIFDIAGDRIGGIEVVADPVRLRSLPLTVA
jgi:RNA polymerase sigma factor (sigma-70 family)